MPDATKHTIPEDEISSWVVKKFNESKNYFQPLFDKFEDWDDQYFGIADKRKYDWQSNVSVPATYKAVKTLLARIVAALFSTNPPFDAVGVEEKDKQGEKPIKDLVGYQFDKTHIFDKFVLFVLQALIRGTSVGKVYYKRDYAYVPREVLDYGEPLPSVDEQGKPVNKKEKKLMQKLKDFLKEPKKKIIYDQKIIYEGADFEVLDLLGGFFPDPFATNLKDGYAIHRTIRTEDYLKKNKDKFENIGEALLTTFPGDSEDWTRSRLKNVGLVEPTQGVPSANTEGEENKTDAAASKYEILECHCQYDVNNDGKLEDAILTICNRAVTIKKRINPYPDGCFVKISFMPVLNEFFGQGVCELVEALQKELNDKTNQRLDNVNLCLQKILVYVEDAIDGKIIKNFVFAPGARLPVKDINAIDWPVVPDVTASAYNETNILKGEIQETSGAVNVLMPTANQSDIHRTASGLFMLKGEAETSIKLIIQMIENQGLAEIAKKYDLMNKLFMTQPQTVRILGEGATKYPKITPDDVRWFNCDFVFKGASAYVNREIRLAQITKLIDSFSKIPTLMMQFDPAKLGKIIANTLGFQDEEVLRQQQMNPMLQGMGLEPQQGLGGGGGASPEMGGPGMEGPLGTVEGLMQQFQEQGGGI